MNEFYYLIYHAEKGKPATATHAALIAVKQKLARVIEDEIRTRCKNETFDVILFKKQALPALKALKLKRLIDAYYDNDNAFHDGRDDRNKTLHDIECWVDDLKTLQDDPNVVWENPHTPPSAALDETYYLYAGLSGGAHACVKVAGKTQAIAAFRYASRKVEHLLDHDTCYGRGVRFLSELEVDDSNHYPTRDELEGVVLATQASLVEGMNLDDYDMLFVRAVIEFCQVSQSTFSIKSDSAGSPHMIQAASGVCVPDIITAHHESIKDSDGTFPNVNIANVTKPIPVYFVDPPKDATLEPKDCPVEGNGGFWESHTSYATRLGIKPGTLTGYRKTSAGARWSSDGSWGETKRGEHVFKVIEPSKSNSETVWWVRNK